jgi:hypothetical protein
MSWERDFRHKIDTFEAAHLPDRKGLAVSIKIGSAGGCYHRQCSPQAYNIIDAYLNTHPLDNELIGFEEHESGPELLVYLALGTAGISLAKSVIDLITTIIKARQEGIRAGDRRDAPIQLRIRRVETDKTVKEDIVLSFTPYDVVNKDILDKALQDYIDKLTPHNTKRGHRKRE